MGCQQSTHVVESSSDHSKKASSKKPIKGIGQTERMVSRAQRVKGQQTTKQPTPPKLDFSGNLMPEEVVRRTSSSIMTQKVTLGEPGNDIQMEYAYWTQRGYYPDDPHKENQDEFSITLKFAGGDRDVMLAVYDGHGENGHSCARFTKNRLHRYIGKYVRQARVKKYQAVLEKQSVRTSKLYDPAKWPLLTTEEYKACCRKAFLECNKAIHDDETVEDKLSGTTAICANFHGNFLTVCNVGDSRVVLGHTINAKNGQNVGTTTTHGGGLPEEEKTEIDLEIGEPSKPVVEDRKVFPTDGKLLAIPLSRDQTPYRKDERERVKRGAVIMSIDQMEGLEELHENWGDMVLGEDVDIAGDPPRVWMEGKDYPGTAFTRSIGDYLAEGIGVTAEPEMLARELTSNDHILVIASDGIFEFLTNQVVIDLCAQCDNPLEACETLVKLAYEKWLTYEARTDDITIIVCFLTCQRPPPTDGIEGTTEDLVDLAKSMYGNKPVRKMTSTSQKDDPASENGESQHGRHGRGSSMYKKEQGEGITLEDVVGVTET